MENASKALIIAGAILLSILIIAIGMFIYNSSAGTIADSADAISSYEKDSFNAIWEAYDKSQPGSNVKTLISKLISNATTYKEEASRLPSLVYKATSGGGEVTVKGAEDAIGDSVESYISNLTKARTAIESKHTYKIELDYSGSTSLVNKITVTY